MTYQKTIVCLAKSSRHGGFCIAGKELDSRKWVRPISNHEDEEIRFDEAICEDRSQLGLFDIVSIRLLEPRPSSYQQENHLIDPAHRWKKIGRITWADLMGLVDNIQGPLWSNGSSSTYGLNDRVPESIARGLSSSLALISPVDLRICVETEGGGFSHPKRKTRAEFSYCGHQYKIAVTDPIVKDKFWSKLGHHSMGNDCLICVSLGEIYEGNAYKLAAAIITKDVLR